jgi:general L-amino acid transport system substrate-binding protein
MCTRERARARARPSAPVLVAVLLAAASASAAPGWPAALAGPSPVLSRARSRGAVRCGAVGRPGLAEPSPDGRPRGLLVDVCRAVAAAVLSAPERVEFRLYSGPADFEAVRRQEEDVSFLTGSEIAEQELSGAVLLLGPVFVERQAVMVPGASPRRDLAALSGQGICFLAGASTERSLEAWFEGHGRSFLRHPYSEDGEMADAYAVQRCHAIAGEATFLAGLRLAPGVKPLRSRLLPEVLSAFPVLATAGPGDGRWAALVAWTVHTLVAGERAETRWVPGGAGAMPVPGEALGLDPGWQRRVLATVGDYRAIFERNLGRGSPLELERGPNAGVSEGGALASPLLD